MSEFEQVEILLVEDSARDAELTMRALKKGGLANKLLWVKDGQEALDYLFDANRALPAIVLLDLRLPRVSGLEVLKRMRADPIRKLVPVVILTSSKDESDIINGYSLGANSYIRKPVDFHNFVEAVAQLGMYWLVLNEAPPAAAPA